MRIITLFVIGCALTVIQAISTTKKDKRQLDYALSQPYHQGGYSFRSERRIQYPPPQYYPGPPRPYRKDPVVIQDQTGGVDRGGNADTIYIPHKPFIKVVEKPVYIKEPEPIIEIIIKESNISLPAPRTEAPPVQKKKKEEVQVFYVKYKKNPHGHGKDAVIYDKPIPAISPPIQEEPEEEQWNEEPSSNYQITEPPKPSTTLRTIIKPDSEVYHSPDNNIKVTFGKEGFDYSKRSSKPEDYTAPRARQLSSFSDVYFKRPAANSYVTSSSNEYRSEVRAPQPYRPFTNYPQPSNRPPFFPPSNNKPTRTSFPGFSHSISHPPPPHFQAGRLPPQYSDIPPPNQRKPVPYTPFENVRPSTQHDHQSPPQPHQNVQFRPETRFNPPNHQYQQPGNQFKTVQPSFGDVKPSHQPEANHQPFQQTNQQPFPEANQHRHQPEANHQQFQQTNQQPFPEGNQHRHQPEANHQQFQHQRPEANQHQHFLQQSTQQHLDNLRTAQRIIPPGGELLQSLSKFEQHLVVDPATGQLTQAPTQRFRSEPSDQSEQFAKVKQSKSENADQYVQNVPQQPTNQNQIFDNSRFGARVTAANSYSSTTPKPTTTTTPEPEKPSTTTKDPKVLEAQLPDEVPDDLRQQLLSSGILNNADISILDYDKVGDIPLSALPPDQLANFYGAGGAQQLAEAGSELRPQVAALTASTDQELSGEESEVSEVTVKPSPEVEMKVVKYNPDTAQGQHIQEGYIGDGAQKVDPVVLNDNTYNRYLPLKVNGTQFPIPDVPELKGKLISSVVILAPITYDFSPGARQTRETPSDDLQLIQNEPLKTLLANPTLDNYKTFLDSEGKTSVAKQAVVLLVTDSKDKEIYMYDLSSKSVSLLSGELSSAFVEAAEANSSDTTS